MKNTSFASTAASGEAAGTTPTKTGGSRNPKSTTSPTLPAVCLAIFVMVWLASGIRPVDRATWLLESLPTAIIVPLLIATYRRFPFSNRAYIQGLVFLILHTIGSHYSYSLVPAGTWLRDALQLTRNHYDRVVHFAFGLLAFRAILELTRGRVVFAISVAATLALCYELVEWRVALVADPSAGTAFLGTQGDEWDAQKDMALACLGAAVAAFAERLMKKA